MSAEPAGSAAPPQQPPSVEHDASTGGGRQRVPPRRPQEAPDTGPTHPNPDTPFVGPVVEPTSRPAAQAEPMATPSRVVVDTDDIDADTINDDDIDAGPIDADDIDADTIDAGTINDDAVEVDAIAPTTAPTQPDVGGREILIGRPGRRPAPATLPLPEGEPTLAPALEPAGPTTPRRGVVTAEPAQLRPPTIDERRDPPRIAPVRPARWRVVTADVGRFAAITWVLTVGWLVFFSLVPLMLGWSPTVISSGSMTPSLDAGDVIHVDAGADLTDVGPGTIITFTDPAGSGRTITHRIAEVVTDDAGVTTGFVTKGDANREPDSTVVPVERVEGVARLVVPYAGLPKVWFDERRWLLFTAFAALTAVAAAVLVDTVLSFVTGRRLGRRSRTLAAIALALAVMTGAPGTGAALIATTDNGANSVSMTPTWFLDTIDRDGPVAHWRLDETTGGSAVQVMSDDFESFTGYSNFGAGSFVSSTAQARSGIRSGLKTGNNDPNGGWKLLPATVTDSFRMEIWVYRPGPWAGGSIDRVGLEDAAFNGYTFNVDHSNNTMRIDRRTGGSANGLGNAVAFDPPENQWYRLELVRAGSALTLNAYDGAGTLLATTAAVDATTNSFDRVVVHGGWDYYVDDLRVWQTFSDSVAIDRIGTLNGTFVGNPAVAQPPLLANIASTSVDFDGNNDVVLLGDSPLINTSIQTERTVEMWFRRDGGGGRQTLYEEGGAVNGMNIYVQGNTLRARAWSQSAGWSNDLETSVGIASNTTFHVAAVLDAVGSRSLTLYLNGVAVDVDTKTDSNQWAAHSDDGAIGGRNGETVYHNGTASGFGDTFNGRIDEVVLFNTALPADRILDHYRAGS